MSDSVVVPDVGYLKACHELCKKHEVLFVADEVQTVCALYLGVGSVCSDIA